MDSHTEFHGDYRHGGPREHSIKDSNDEVRVN